MSALQCLGDLPNISSRCQIARPPGASSTKMMGHSLLQTLDAPTHCWKSASVTSGQHCHLLVARATPTTHTPLAVPAAPRAATHEVFTFGKHPTEMVFATRCWAALMLSVRWVSASRPAPHYIGTAAPGDHHRTCAPLHVPPVPVPGERNPDPPPARPPAECNQRLLDLGLCCSKFPRELPAASICFLASAETRRGEAH